MPYKDREKRLEAQKRYEERNREKIKIHKREYERKNREKIKARKKKQFQNNKTYYMLKKKEYLQKRKTFINDLKLKLGCKICGSKERLEFHHIDSKTKITSVANMVSYMGKWDSVLEEIKKCEVLCNPCHRYIHKINGKPRKNKKIQDDKLDNYI